MTQQDKFIIEWVRPLGVYFSVQLTGYIIQEDKWQYYPWNSLDHYLIMYLQIIDVILKET